MGTVVSWFVATIITLPIIGYLIVFICTKQLTKNHRKAVHFAMNCVTLLVILSVHFIIQTIWEVSLLWGIMMLMLLLAMVVVIVHHKQKGEIHIPRVLKSIWRLNGLIFIIIYCILVITGITINVIRVF